MVDLKLQNIMKDLNLQISFPKMKHMTLKGKELRAKGRRLGRTKEQ